ncbi:hypothetical protein T310_8952, partial [Rasamsonia emersonii CBS 393.64]
EPSHAFLAPEAACRGLVLSTPSSRWPLGRRLRLHLSEVWYYPLQGGASHSGRHRQRHYDMDDITRAACADGLYPHPVRRHAAYNGRKMGFR